MERALITRIVTLDGKTERWRVVRVAPRVVLGCPLWLELGAAWLCNTRAQAIRHVKHWGDMPIVLER